MNRIRAILLRLGPVALFVGLWWVAVAMSESVIFPSPWQVVLGSAELGRKGLLVDHVVASLFRVSTGYLLAMAVAIPLGIVMGWFGSIFAALNPIIQILRPISPIAWIPIAILWFGIGDVSPIFLIFLASIFPTMLETTAGVHTIERAYIRAAQNFGISKLMLFRQVVIPAALPATIVGMRISLGVAWLVVVAAEMIALKSGLGYLIIDSRNAGNRYDLVVAGMLIIGAIGLVLDFLMRKLETLEEVDWKYGR